MTTIPPALEAQTTPRSAQPPESSILFSAAQAADRAAIEALLVENNLTTEDLSAVEEITFFVARHAERVVGVAGLQAVGAVGLLRSVAVAAPYRGRGLAARLVQAVEADARSRGLTALYLLTTTAEAFFAARGYARTDRAAAPAALQATREFLDLCPETAVCLAKAV